MRCVLALSTALVGLSAQAFSAEPQQNPGQMGTTRQPTEMQRTQTPQSNDTDRNRLEGAQAGDSSHNNPGTAKAGTAKVQQDSQSGSASK